ncbi:unnamed protein product [Leptidea sinapis]|uniref:Uncharacterized protein n=1 Tax=Leptidea sinapis TaxID=189913 RepID=A0A5E4PVM4_9NEOP|nr:unnamed protein product [Leptidea sinapis]
MSEEPHDEGGNKSPSLSRAEAVTVGAECGAHVNASTNVSQTNITQCTMCRTNKPSLGEDIFKLQDGASAEAVTERLKPLRISSPQGQASASSINKWSCLVST